CDRVFGASVAPFHHRFQRRGRQRARGDAEKRKHSCGVAPEAALPGRYVVCKVMLFTAPGEEAKPEGRAIRLGPEFGNPLCAELWTQLPDELNTFIGFQWAEIDGRHSLFAQILDQGVLEGQSPTGGPGGGDDGERYFLFRS